MLTFKLSRRGKTKQPTYRLVVVDKKKDPWGMVKEDVGSYNPHTKKAQFKAERIKFWISKGAQPSATVHNLLVKEKILEAPKKKIKMKSSSTSTSSAKSADSADKKATEDKEKLATADTQKTAPAEVPKAEAAVVPPSGTMAGEGKTAPAEAPKTEEPKTETPKTEEKPKEEISQTETSAPAS